MNKNRPIPLKPLSIASVFTLIRDSIWIIFLIVPSVLAAVLKNIFFRPLKDLNGKIVLVTGAGNGLGKELSIQLSKQGCQVICVDIKQENNEETVREIIQCNGHAVGYCCDVSNPKETQNLSNVILDEFGKVDILINNAGIIFGNGILTGTIEEIRKVIDVNLLSSLWMIRAFLPDMTEKNEGHIVCIASASGIHSLSQGNIYSSSKFALLGMIYGMIEELRKDVNTENIKVSCALPYFINTNKLYSNHWKLRLPPLSTKKAAALVIEGIRREYKFYTVPWIAFGYTISTLYRLLPINVYRLFRDKFYADFTYDDNPETKLFGEKKKYIRMITSIHSAAFCETSKTEGMIRKLSCIGDYNKFMEGVE